MRVDPAGPQRRCAGRPVVSHQHAPHASRCTGSCRAMVPAIVCNGCPRSVECRTPQYVLLVALRSAATLPRVNPMHL